MDTQNTKTRRRARSKSETEAAIAAANEASAQLGKQHQASKTKEATKPSAPKRARKSGTQPAGTGTPSAGQQQAADTPAPQKRSARAKKTTDTGLGQQQQSLGEQNAGSASTELRGGAKQVLITEMPMSGRTGRPAGVEDYPFGDLKPSKKVGNEIVGPSFFIPKTDKAEGKLAVARKRHGGLFWARTRFEKVNGEGEPVEGLRIWRGTPELADLAKR